LRYEQNHFTKPRLYIKTIAHEKGIFKIVAGNYISILEQNAKDCGAKSICDNPMTAY
jgi:hypothetical protein